MAHRRGAQVNSPLARTIVLAPAAIEQNSRLFNVGPKPAKWVGDTRLSTFITDLILYYHAAKLPPKRGIASLAFLDNACCTKFWPDLQLSRVYIQILSWLPRNRSLGTASVEL